MAKIQITRKESRRRSALWAVSFLAILAFLLPPAISQSEQAEKLLPEDFRGHVHQLSTVPMLIAAEALGVTEIEGKPLDVGEGPPGEAKAKILKDVGIGVNPTKHENSPNVAANPKNGKNLVASSNFSGPPAPTANRCVVYTSSDGGATWSNPRLMPQLVPSSSCANPVLAYAPSGNRVYYAYTDIKMPSLGGVDVVVSYSDDDGQNWTGPVIALDGVSTGPLAFIYDKPWIATHVDDRQNDWVYVTATRMRLRGDIPPSSIVFTSSNAQAAAGSWSSPSVLDSGALSPVFTLVQGSRPAGGRGEEVLVAWFHSGSDGWLRGSFLIRTRRSPDHGATWDPIVDAAVDSSETPFFLGPFGFYHTWWTAMFPDVKIDSGGQAHIVYTHDPVASSTTPEDGDIRYIMSSGPPYQGWSMPVTVNDDGLPRAQGFAALETHDGGQGQSSIIHVTWEDHRLTPELPIIPLTRQSPNLFYDNFYARKVPGSGVGWSQNFRVSDASSISDLVSVGDYNGLTQSNGLLFSAWTDRRHRTSVTQTEDNVFGSRIIAGGGTP